MLRESASRAAEIRSATAGVRGDPPGNRPDAAPARARFDRSAGSALRCVTCTRHWSLPARLVIAATIVLAAFGVRVAFLPGLEDRLIYITLFPAVAISAVAGRWAGGMLAMGLGAVLGHTWLAPLASNADWLGLATFAFSCVLVSAVAAALHATLDKLEAREAGDARAAVASQLAAIVETPTMR